MFEELSIIFAGFLTLCIFSFLYKDNPFYRFAEHLYVGVSAGYMMSRGMADVMMKKLYTPLFNTPQGTAIDYSLIIPIVLGLFMILKLVPKVDWLSRWAIALVVGGTIGLSMTTRFKSDVIIQVRQTVEAIQSKEASLEKIKKTQYNIEADYSNELKMNSAHMEAINKLNQFLVWEAMALRSVVKSDGGVKNVSDDSLKGMQAGWLKAGEAKLEMDKQLKAMKTNLLGWQKLYSSAKVSIKNKQVALKEDVSKFFKNESASLSYNDLDMKSFKLGKELEKLQKLEVDLASSEVILKLRVKSLSDTITKVSSHFYPPAPNRTNLEAGLKAVQVLQKSLQQLMANFQSLEGDLASYVSASSYFSSKEKDPLLSVNTKSFFKGSESSMQSTFIKEDLQTGFSSTAYDLFKNLLIAFGVLTILVYFFFSTEHKGAVGVGAKVGIYFLMITFGASFGYTIMARISLLIGRMDFLIVDVSKAFTSMGL
ncbi:MAG: hypothetical protein KC646_09990 [Candidatus Cloacimonetes bacterium]|nr:hypothetical protein [Candidatus Cloacimonadota bacterium]